MMKVIRKLLIYREGLLPPSESTYTVHELVHVVDQIIQLGPPLMSSMFKYEQKNRWIKGLIKNHRYPLASVVKNYLISESCSFLVSLNYDTYRRMQNLFEFANSKFKAKISRSMRTILNLQFDPIKQKIACVEEELALEDDFDVHEAEPEEDEENVGTEQLAPEEELQHVPQDLLSFLLSREE
jgi:hypothetical protein